MRTCFCCGLDGDHGVAGIPSVYQSSFISSSSTGRHVAWLPASATARHCSCILPVLFILLASTAERSAKTINWRRINMTGKHREREANTQQPQLLRPYCNCIDFLSAYCSCLKLLLTIFTSPVVTSTCILHIHLYANWRTGTCSYVALENHPVMISANRQDRDTAVCFC